MHIIIYGGELQPAGTDPSRGERREVRDETGHTGPQVASEQRSAGAVGSREIRLSERMRPTRLGEQALRLVERRRRSWRHDLERRVRGRHRHHLAIAKYACVSFVPIDRSTEGRGEGESGGATHLPVVPRDAPLAPRLLDSARDGDARRKRLAGI